jgi:hypothetical protein
MLFLSAGWPFTSAESLLVSAGLPFVTARNQISTACLFSGTMTSAFDIYNQFQGKTCAGTTFVPREQVTGSPTFPKLYVPPDGQGGTLPLELSLM